MITIQGSQLKWVPVKEMVEHADMTDRRGKNEPWREIAHLVEQLVARPQILGEKVEHEVLHVPAVL